MFIGAKVQNAAGNILELNDAAARKKFILSSVQGLNPPPAQLNVTTIVGMDGGRLNSAFLNTRNLVLTFLLRGDQEQNRQELYDYFNTKDSCRFFFRNVNRDVYIDGYVETVECDMFQRTEELQVSIIAPCPYFSGVNLYELELGAREALFTFPFSINMDDPVPLSEYDIDRAADAIIQGDTETGCNILVKVKQPFTAMRIRNATTGQQIRLNDFPFLAGDEIRICTIPGQKDLVLVRDGIEERVFEALADGSVFFQLVPGANLLEYDVSGQLNEDAADVTVRYRNAYKGV